MFELLSADTPNGKKVSILLEELDLKYKVKKVNIFKGDQFKPSFDLSNHLIDRFVPSFASISLIFSISEN